MVVRMDVVLLQVKKMKRWISKEEKWKEEEEEEAMADKGRKCEFLCFFFFY